MIGGLVAGAAVAAVASGQCVPGWSEDFRGAFFFGGFRASATVFDDGSGPKLVVSGLGRRGEADRGLQAWDGHSWSMLALPQGALSNEGIVRAFNDHVPPRLVFAENDSWQDDGEVFLLENGVWEALGFPTGPSSSWVTGVVQGLDPTGEDIFVCGRFRYASGESTLVYHWDGQAWIPTDLGAGSAATSLAWFDDGSGPKLYAGVYFKIGGVSASGVARWDGQAWEEVGGGCPAEWPTITTHDDGTGLALWALDSDGVELAKWDGVSWTSYPLAPEARGESLGLASMELEGRRELVWIERLSNRSHLWQWDGVAGEIFGEITAGGVREFAQDPTGSLGDGLFAAGGFLHAGEVEASSVARWDGQAWHALGNGDIGNGVRYGNAVIALGDDAGPALGRRVYVSTDIAGGQDAHEVAAWDGQRWDAIGPSDMSNVNISSFAAGDLGSGTRLFATGTLIHAPDTGYAVIGWDGQDWSVVGDELNLGARRLAFGQIAGGEPTLYVAGNFTETDGEANSGVVGLTASGWVSLGGGLADAQGRPSIEAIALHDDGSGVALYSGAPYDPVNSNFENSVVRWDGHSWSRVGAEFYNSGDSVIIFALISADLGDGPKLYAGGWFHGLGNVAAWDGEDWLPLGDGLSFTVKTLAKVDTPEGPRLAAAGDIFTDGELAERVWLWDGSTWSPFGAIADDRIFGVVQAEYEGDAIYLAGDFHQIAGVSSEGLARFGCASCPADFNHDGTLDTRDFIAFLASWAAGDHAADFDANGTLDTRDFIAYLGAWAAGC